MYKTGGSIEDWNGEEFRFALPEKVAVVNFVKEIPIKNWNPISSDHSMCLRMVKTPRRFLSSMVVLEFEWSFGIWGNEYQKKGRQ